MADVAALHDAVVAAPDDEAPRIAYATAIAATDPERAEFIQAQLELARAWRAEQPGPAEAARRAQILEHAHGRRWAEGLPATVESYGFRRGFVEDVGMDAAAFLDAAPALFLRAPILHLTLKNVAPVSRRLFASPALTQIVSLSLVENDLGDDDIAALAASPYVGHLRWLDLDFNRVGERGLEALAASDKLPRLGYVCLGHNPVDDPTPRHADEYSSDTPAARELQRKYGPRRWLSTKPPREWPPRRDAP